MRALLLIVLALPAVFPPYLTAQQLYTCKTPEGRLVMRDTPCPAGSAETVVEPQAGTRPQPSTAPTSTRPSSGVSKPARPAPSAASSPVLEPEVPLHACVNMDDVATEVVSHGRRRDLRWKVSVSNRCKRPLQTMVVFGLYDRHDFEIRARRQKLRVPARDSATAQGTMTLSAGDVQRIASKKAEVYLP